MSSVSESVSVSVSVSVSASVSVPASRLPASSVASDVEHDAKLSVKQSSEREISPQRIVGPPQEREKTMSFLALLASLFDRLSTVGLSIFPRDHRELG